MELGFANPYGTHTALSAVQNMGGQVRPGVTPPPDRGSSIGSQNVDVDTADIYLANSAQKATAWRVRRGAKMSVNAAMVGHGDVQMPSQSTPTRVQEM